LTNILELFSITGITSLKTFFFYSLSYIIKKIRGIFSIIKEDEGQAVGIRNDLNGIYERGDVA
jgi:hypothetical protein